MNDTEFVKRLARAGIDGVQVNYKRSWISIIRNEVLRDASGIDKEFVREGLLATAPEESLAFTLAIQGRPFVEEEVFKNFPKIGLLGKIIERKSLSRLEVNSVMKTAVSRNFVIINGSSKPAMEYLRQEILSPFLESKLNGDVNGLKAALAVATSVAVDANALNLSLNHLDRKSSAQKEIYEGILRTFDLRDLWLQRDPSGRIPSKKLEKMKSIAKNWVEAEKMVDQIKNEDLAQLLTAVAVAMGNVVPQFRDFVAYMGPEGSRGTYIKTNAVTARSLRANPLLTTKVLNSQSNADQVRIYVEYPSALNYKTYEDLLSKGLLKKLDQLTPRQLANSDNKIVRELTEKIVAELTGALFDPTTMGKVLEKMLGYGPSPDVKKVFSIIDFYRAFVAIHPLAEGNGRAARLLYRLLSKATNAPQGLKLKMVPPLFDSDLFVPSWELESLIKIGLIMDDWISRAKNDEEFMERVEAAFNLLPQIKPDLPSVFPGLWEKL